MAKSKKPIELTWEIEFTGDKWNCIVEFGRYGNNNRTAIELMDKFTREHIMTCTTNLPKEDLADTSVAIKNYSENEGILDKLIEAGVIAKPHALVQSGFVKIPICKLLVNPEDYE